MTDDSFLACLVVLGPRKCGTTTLYSLLSQVPGLVVPGPIKETHLFDDGPVSFCELMRLGRHNLTLQSTAFIDVSTHYFSRVELWRNIIHTPEVIKVAVVIRDPVERFISHCLHQMRTKNEWELTVDEIVARYSEVASDSFYSEKIPDIYEAFGEENVLLINFEDLKNDPQRAVEFVCTPLGVKLSDNLSSLVPHQQNPGLKPKFPAVYKSLRMSAGCARRLLGDRLVEHIKQRVVKIWPVADLGELKIKLERQLYNHELGARLIQEQQYVCRLLAREKCE